MNFLSLPGEAILEDPTSNQDLACLGDNMITRQDLSSAVDCKEGGVHDTKVHPSLRQEYNESMLPGHRETGKFALDQ